MKFIPAWKKVSVKKPFDGFNDFRRKMTNKMFFEETKPGVFLFQFKRRNSQYF